MHNSFSQAFKNIIQDNRIKIQVILIHVCKVNVSYIKYVTADVRISWRGFKINSFLYKGFDDHAVKTVFQYYWALISEDDNIPNKLQEQAHQVCGNVIYSSDSASYFPRAMTNEICFCSETPLHLALTCILGDQTMFK